MGKYTTQEIQDYQEASQKLFDVVNSEVVKYLNENYECIVMEMCSCIDGHDTYEIGWSDYKSMENSSWANCHKWLIETLLKTVTKIQLELKDLGVNHGDKLYLREAPSTWEDPHLLKQKKIGYYGWLDVSYVPTKVSTMSK